MKVRNGYVSNSSSSSFVVKVRDFSLKKNNKILISKKDIEKLTEFGFEWMGGYEGNILFCPEKVVKSMNEFNENEQINLYMDCTCNEDEIYEFLFKNKIPFIASIHYDHELWVYNGGDYYEIFQNYAMQYLMQSESTKDWFIKQTLESKPYQKIYLNKKNQNDEVIYWQAMRITEYKHIIEKLVKDKFTEKEWNKINRIVSEINGKEWFEELKKWRELN